MQKGSGQNSRRAQLSRVRLFFFVLILLLLDGMLKWLWVRTAGKNHRAVRAPFKKKNEVKNENFVEQHLLWSRLFAVYFRPFSN